MIILPKEVNFKIFFYLPLESIQNTALTCKDFSKMIDSEFFWRNFLPHVVPTNASVQFLAKFGFRLSLRQIVVVNFLNDSKKIECFKNSQVEKINILYKLICSIQSLEKFTIINEWEKYGKQRPYAHMLHCWGDNQSAIQMLEMKKAAKGVQKNDWNELKGTFNANLDKLLNQVEDYQSCCLLFSRSQFYLQIEAAEELTLFYHGLWKHYSPLTLDPLLGSEIGNMYSFMPLESFTGFCQSVSQKKVFGELNGWYLSEAHLLAFNSAFNECKVECIDICLLPDVKKATLECFIELIKNENQLSAIRVDFMYPQFDESRELFENFDARSCKNIKRWDLID